MLCRLLFLLPVTLAATVSWAAHTVDLKIGPFDLSGPLIPESELIYNYGNGATEVASDGISSHVYYVKADRLWVQFSLSDVAGDHGERFVDTILISKQRLSKTEIAPIIPFGKLKTGTGVAVGDSTDDVIRSYGTPSKKVEIKNGNTFSSLRELLKPTHGDVLRYFGNEPDMNVLLEFLLYDNRVDSILVSAAE